LQRVARRRQQIPPSTTAQHPRGGLCSVPFGSDGKVERDLLALFPAAIMIRLGALRPMHGERSKAPGGGVLLTLLSPLWPIFQWLWPSGVITSEALGRAMIRVARDGAPTRVLESADLVALGRSTH